MTVDNFELLKNLMIFDSADDFYILEIIKRRKENPNMVNGAKVLKHYFLYDGDLDARALSIMDMCQRENARAYLRLNRRSAARIALKTLQVIASLIETGQVKSAAQAYYSAACDYHSDPRKSWVVDVDQPELREEVIETIMELKAPIYAVNPTINGLHVISGGFNRATFSAKYPQVSVHKDNPTLLYYSTPFNKGW